MSDLVYFIIFIAFPNVPWVYLYRQPVETMMSQVGKGKSSGGYDPPFPL